MENTMTDVSTVLSPVPISDQELQIIMIVIVCTILELISIFGTICNIINIIIFAKQGMKDTTNISLLGIAVADTGSLVTLLWGSVCMNPLMIQRFEDFDMTDIQYLTSARPHIYFVSVTGWLTSFVTIERYLCIAYPLKVRSLVTPQRTIVLNVTVFVIIITYLVPVFTSASLGRKFNASKNRTQIGIVYTSDAETIETMLSYFDNISKLISFLTVAFMTIMLVHKLNYTSKWRNSTLTTYKTGKISTRDQRVMVMVVFISVIFILCYFPLVVFFVVMKFEKELSFKGTYKNIFITVGYFIFLLEAINSTANIFVYLRMSSRYRKILVSLFTWISRKR